MILRHAHWNPDWVPWVKLTEEDIQGVSQELVRFHQQFHGCYRRLEHHRLGLAYFSGLLSNLEAKSVEPIALAFLDEHTVRPLQQFLKGAVGITRRWSPTSSPLGRCLVLPKGMITADTSEFLKKGKESVGVARQYCGALGKVDNCQSGVFIGYSSSRGYGLLTGQLYMPKNGSLPPMPSVARTIGSPGSPLPDQAPDRPGPDPKDCGKKTLCRSMGRL